MNDKEVDRVFDLAQSDPIIGKKLKSTISIIRSAIRIFGKNNVTISFNGGKDCTVMLHLFYAVLWRYYRQEGEEDKDFELPGVCISDPESITFPDIESFIGSSVQTYSVRLEKIPGPMKEGLESYKLKYPSVNALLVGTRVGDPHADDLESFSPCDDDWPAFMRVNAILHWTYCDVWHFLTTLNIPYCSLYDRGYTSLGHTYNTVPNETLRDPTTACGYQPAYMLKDSHKERVGRLDSKKQYKKK
eukprot:TRINITY_DN1689_c0_g1_i1.p1 TRINITY_DN1689_c0_g1~~TRINITY_DN1689_c0_g1_i1.p1  ORF type:complete len:282 (+),score=57.95 TRINITY_DN1689_c0_g1_i1:114-848(+)